MEKMVFEKLFILFGLLLLSPFYGADAEVCGDRFGGYCNEKGLQGCCVPNQPVCSSNGIRGSPMCYLCLGDGCEPRIGAIGSARCNGTPCPADQVCMLLGGRGKDKCVPKEVSICKEYIRTEAVSHCGKQGYPLGYGHKYCNRFYENYADFNEDGQKFVKCVGQCLVDKMKEIVQTAGRDCTTLHNAAYDSHTPCYLGCGINNATVLVPNIRTFNRVIDLKDALSVEGLKQIAAISNAKVTDVGREFAAWAVNLLP